MYAINEKKYPCEVSLAMKFIGGKWKAVILMHLISGEKRYHELKKAIPTITERTLSMQLRQLEEDGLINRTASGVKPPLRVSYRLTDFGKTLIPILKLISNWGKNTVSYCSKISFTDL